MQFLFERLSPAPPVLSEEEREARLRRAVLEQLDWLVGSREWRGAVEGTALIDAVMPEPPALAATAADVRRYAERLGRLVARWEPRLLDPKVQIVPTGRLLAPLRIVIEGTLDRSRPESVIRFEREPGPR